MSLPPSYNLLEKYPNPVYVETGTWEGDSLYLALKAGFKRIIGIELSLQKTTHCFKRFEKQVNSGQIRLVCGDSALWLYDTIKEINGPITFFLDGHTQFFEDEEPTDNPLPLLDELKQIARHPVKTHTILIDDILILTHPDTTGWTREIIEAHIYAINPNYKVEYIANPVKRNFIVAHL